MSATLELLLLAGAMLVIAIATATLLHRRRALRADQSHLGRLLGRTDAEAPATEEEKAPGAFERRLQAAGIGWSPVAVIALAVVIGLVVMLLVAGVSPRIVWAAPIVAFVFIWMIASLVSEAARQRAWRFERRLVDAIDLMVGALAAGQAPVDAIENGGDGALEPVRRELRELAAQLRASVPVERAVQRMLARYDSESVRIFTQLLIARWEVGGPLAPTLQAVTRTMRHGQRLRAQLHTHVAAAQTAAIVVAIIPYLLVAFFLWKRPQSLAAVWSLAWGPQAFVAAVVLQIIGFASLRQILRTEL